MSHKNVKIALNAQKQVLNSRKWRLTGSLWICLLLGVLHVSAAFGQKLFWAYTDFEPYMVTNNQGKADGTLITLMDCISKDASFEYQAVNLSNKRAAQLLRNNTNFAVTIKAFVRNPDDYVFGKEVVDYLTLRVYWQGERTPVKRWDDLNNRQIIVLRGYSYGGKRSYINDVANGIQVTAEVETHARGLNLLEKGRGDYFIGYKGPTEWARSETVKTLNHADLGVFPMYFVMSKTVKNAEGLLAEMEQGLAGCR